jgi:hypothetical protein
MPVRVSASLVHSSGTLMPVSDTHNPRFLALGTASFVRVTSKPTIEVTDSKKRTATIVMGKTHVAWYFKRTLAVPGTSVEIKY